MRRQDENSHRPERALDGVYAGVPYRVAPDGSIDAIMHRAMVRFRDFDKIYRIDRGVLTMQISD